jgi:acetylglutamate synthase
MKIFETEVADLDTLDPDVLAGIENAKDRVIKAVEKAPKMEKQSEAIRVQCQAVADFIDELFGEGTSYKVFNGRTNLLLCMQAFDQIIEEINKNADRQYEEMQTIMAKYSPRRIK